MDNYSLIISRYLKKKGDELALFLSGHWLGLVNLFLLVVILGSLLAPLFAHLNLPRESRIIYAVYHIACHQKQSRSLFLFGHKMGVCARCFSIYDSLFVLGLVYSIFTRWEIHVKPLIFKLAFLSALPLISDGLLQILTRRESTNGLRIASGVLFGLGWVLFFYPRLEQGLGSRALALRNGFDDDNDKLYAKN